MTTPAPPAPLPDWEDYIAMLRPVGGHIPTNGWGMGDAGAIQEYWRICFAAAVQCYLNYVSADIDYPDFAPAYDMSINLAAPVPDYRYKATLIEGSGVYRISGFRGTSRFVDLTVFTSLFSLGKTGRVASRVSLDDLTLAADGQFSFILSATRPEGHDGDWHALDPEAIRLQVRHACYDWFGEVDARIAIERLDRPARKPRVDPAKLADRLSQIARWTENSVRFGIDHVARQAAKGIVNRLEYIDWGAVGGFDPRIQTYYEGLFDLAPDEALILETTIPEQARYWSFLLSDPLFATIDWMNCQSSLNGHQARIDGDGRCRMVVAREDPGVPNWLDTGGYARGVIQVRWNECSTQPLPSAMKVSLSALRDHLPADTPHVTPAERDAALRRRRAGAQMRSRW